MSSSSSSDQIFTSFFSKVGELIQDYSNNFMKSINEFKLSLESLQKSLMLLNAKASDVEEQIKFPQGLGQKKRKREIDEWLRRVKSIENEVVELRTQAESEGFIRNLMVGGKVAQLNEEVVVLVEESQHFDELLLDARGTRGVEFLTTRMIGEEFEENVNKIWTLLETRKVSSIGIHGMGGVGKTALAKCINNRLLKQFQVRVFWITVSHEFTIKNLQDKIARFLGLNLMDEDDEGIRAARLHKSLTQMQNSVLILDDLWECIDLLKVGCLVSVECCRLIITTRSLEVCRQMRCQRVIIVETLCNVSAWKLFIATLTPGEEIELDASVEEIAKPMARLCGGLPLRIITVAGRMRGKTSIHLWKNALTELNESLTRLDGRGDVEIFRVLKYSFDRLNNQSQSKGFNLFQQCFLHCSLYPQGHLPPTNELVERFISEGLVDGRKSRREQVDQGYAILDYLVDVCLLEPYYVRCVRVHELLRAMALKIVEGKFMVRSDDCRIKEIPHEQEWTKDLEVVFLMGNKIEIIRDGTSPNCPKLSTLLLHDNPLRAIPDSFFSKMKQLLTLDLRRTRITMLPNSVSNLTRLEALLLEGCDMLEIVPYLGKLKALRELNLSETAIEKVPQGVEELLNLKALSIDAPYLEMFPRGLLLKLVHIQIVKFAIQVLVREEELLDLKEMELFNGRLNSVCAFNCFIKSRRHETSYKVHVGPVNEQFYFKGYKRELYMSEYHLKDEKVYGHDIMALTINKCEGLSNCLLDDFSPSSYPKSLEILTITRCRGVEWLLTSSRGSPSQFPVLECVELDELEHFKGLIQKGEIRAVSTAPAEAVFSSLRKLNIENCKEMRKLGLPVLGAPNLEDITISNCAEVEEIFEDEGKDCVTRPQLKCLSLSELPKLESVCNAKLICNSISTICIEKCPRLKVPLHLDVPPPPSLTAIEVEREWWESLEWYNPNLPQLLEPFVEFSS